MPIVDQGSFGNLAAGLESGLGGYLEAKKEKDKLDLAEKHRQEQFSREDNIRTLELEAKGYTKDTVTGRLVRTPEHLAEEKRKLDNEAKSTETKHRFDLELAAAKDKAEGERQEKLKRLEFAQQNRMKSADNISALQRESIQQGLGYLDPQSGKFVATAPSPSGSGLLSNKDRKDIGAGAWAAANYATRMEQAEADFSRLAQSGYRAEGSGAQLRRDAADVPLVGGLLGQARTSSDRSQEQAERNFVNAVLRKESGAAISPEEFKSASLQYFPRRGDTAEVLAQKAANRKLVVDNFKAEAGKAYTAMAPQMPSQRSGLLLKAGAEGLKEVGGVKYRKVPGGWEEVE